MIMFLVGSQNSSEEFNKTLEPGQFYVMGDKPASKIVAEYSSTQPIDVYVTTDQNVKYGIVWSLDSIDDCKNLDSGKTSGKIDYDTPDTGKNYYLLLTN